MRGKHEKVDGEICGSPHFPHAVYRLFSVTLFVKTTISICKYGKIPTLWNCKESYEAHRITVCSPYVVLDISDGGI